VVLRVAAVWDREERGRRERLGLSRVFDNRLGVSGTDKAASYNGYVELDRGGHCAFCEVIWADGSSLVIV